MKIAKKKTVLLFFAVTLGLTILSRAADSFLVARVELTACRKEALLFEITGSGTVIAEKREFQYGLEGLRIKRLLVTEGTKVEAGEVTAIVDLVDLEEKIEETQEQIRKLEIQIEQNKLSGGSRTEMKPAATAEALEQQYRKEDLEEAKAELVRAQEEYERAGSRTAKELLESREEFCKEADASYDVFLGEYHNAVDGAYEDWMELEEEIADHPKTEFDKAVSGLNFQADGFVAEDEGYDYFAGLYLKNASEDEINAAKSAIEEYHAGSMPIEVLYAEICKEDIYLELLEEVEELSDRKKKAEETYRKTKETWKQKMEIEKEKVEKAEKALERVQSGDYDIKKEIAEEEQALKAAQERVKELERAIAAGEIEADQKLAAESAEQKEEVDGARKRELAEESLLIDLENLRSRLDKLREVHEREGQLIVETTGRIEHLLIAEGERIGDEGLMSINTGNYYYQGEMTSTDAGYLGEGDKIDIRFAGRQDAVESRIEGITVGADGVGRITAALPPGEYYSGITAAYEIRKNSEEYDSCILLAALRQDMEGYYVLEVRPHKTVLGEQLVAERLSVILLEKDRTKAAVRLENPNADGLILSANKQVAPGDRVRIME